ncbi:hypothetical protein CTAYLR_002998 [Chrysophaeum taylorii]|uniref:RGS domain-containing protein n=1 Tax=Chrysophaeum taylorii TaxID=2483200 RepID=A0AAD7U7A6_9STRA|nr:hypothetical protein CTAYLR_002998 [Chrysophaeum taylorii]
MGARVSSRRERSSGRAEVGSVLKREDILRNTMRSILEDAGQRRIFSRFLDADFCGEISRFLRACTEYEALCQTSATLQKGDDPTLQTKAREMYELFLCPRGRWCLHASASASASVELKLESPDASTFEAVEAEIVDFCARRKLLAFREWLETHEEEEEEDGGGGSIHSWDFERSLSEHAPLSEHPSVGSDTWRRPSALLLKNIVDASLKEFRTTTSTASSDDYHDIWDADASSLASSASVALTPHKAALVRLWDKDPLSKTGVEAFFERRRWSALGQHHHHHHHFLLQRGGEYAAAPRAAEVRHMPRASELVRALRDLDAKLGLGALQHQPYHHARRRRSNPDITADELRRRRTAFGRVLAPPGKWSST